MTGFVCSTCGAFHEDMPRLLTVAAPPYLYSGPSPVASLATVLAGFDVNEARGDELDMHIAVTHLMPPEYSPTGGAIARGTPRICAPCGCWPARRWSRACRETP